MRGRGLSRDMEEDEKFIKDIRLTGNENIIIAVIRLPFIPTKEANGTWTLQPSNVQ
jgi:hypothetical protein